MTRRTAIAFICGRLRQRIDHFRGVNPDCHFSVLAHSFGAYAIAHILASESDIRLHCLALCGSVLPLEFDLNTIRQRGQITTPIINDCGTLDIWPCLAQCASWGYGNTGVVGYGAGMKDRFHKLDHSGFLTRTFAKKFWKPLFQNDDVKPSDHDESRLPPPSWLSALSMLPIRWLLLAFVVALVALPIRHVIESRGRYLPGEMIRGTPDTSRDVLASMKSELSQSDRLDWFEQLLRKKEDDVPIEGEKHGIVFVFQSKELPSQARIRLKSDFTRSRASDVVDKYAFLVRDNGFLPIDVIVDTNGVFRLELSEVRRRDRLWMIFVLSSESELPSESTLTLEVVE